MLRSAVIFDVLIIIYIKGFIIQYFNIHAVILSEVGHYFVLSLILLI